MTKSFSVRFDVDTHRCVREGMPALIDLGRELDAPFTFFVNMGRAVSRRAMLGRVLGGQGAGPNVGAALTAPAAKLSAREKLGTAGYLWAAIANPRVGAGAPDVLLRAVQEGHEVGLHGGTNHALWQVMAHGWGPDRLAAEIDAVYPALTTALGGQRPYGFASPGWSTHPALPDILASRGFTYLADLHGPADTSTTGSTETTALPNLRTQLTGEPGGVAYLEHLRAIGLDDDALVRRFETDLDTTDNAVVMYDHPYFAGLRELHTIRRLVEIARDGGYEIVTLATLADRCRA